MKSNLGKWLMKRTDQALVPDGMEKTVRFYRQTDLGVQCACGKRFNIIHQHGGWKWVQSTWTLFMCHLSAKFVSCVNFTALLCSFGCTLMVLLYLPFFCLKAADWGKTTRIIIDEMWGKINTFLVFFVFSKHNTEHVLYALMAPEFTQYL